MIVVEFFLFLGGRERKRLIRRLLGYLSFLKNCGKERVLKSMFCV